MIRRALIIATLALGAPAAAHDWYPRECCSGHDCAPIPATELTLTKEGWLWKNADGERLFGFTSPDLRVSPDGQPHGCQRPWDRYKRCLFVSEGAS